MYCIAFNAIPVLYGIIPAERNSGESGCNAVTLVEVWERWYGTAGSTVHKVTTSTR